MSGPRSREVLRRFLAGESVRSIADFVECRRRKRCLLGPEPHGHGRISYVPVHAIEDILRRAMLRGGGRGK